MPGRSGEESHPPNAHATAPILPTITHHPPPPRSKIDREFVRKFCRICGPICIILSICLAIYFLHVTLITVVFDSKSMTMKTANQLWSAYKALLISLIVLGCITLVAFVLGLLSNCSCLLFLYSFHHFASNLTILMGIVALFMNPFNDPPTGLYIAMTVFFFLAFFFFTNYTHWQILKLGKIMRTGPATITVSYNPTNGPPILYSLPEDGTAIPPPYPGAPSIPFVHPQPYDEPPKYGNWTVRTSLS